MSERNGIISIPFASGVTVDIENTRSKVAGNVWTISEKKPESSDIDLAISIGFPETYVSWLENSRQLPNNYLQGGPVRDVNELIGGFSASSQDVCDRVAKITRDSWTLDY